MIYKTNDYLDLLEKNNLVNKSDIKHNALIENVTYNSKKVVKGTLFICKGAHFKKEYLEEAVKNGAVCYAAENDLGVDANCIIVKDIRRAMALMFNMYSDNVWKKLNLIGITGTKGKTTTTYFIKYILDEYLKSVQKPSSAYISSIDTYDGVEKFESHLTTPEIGELTEHFGNAVNSGIEYLTMEVSSQALKYDRVYGVGFDVGVYLNIGEDHISNIEHPDFDDYFYSKMKIFSQTKTACVSLDTLRREEVLKAASVCERIITFSSEEENADIYAYNIRKSGNDTVFDVRTPEYTQEFTLTIPGLFNVQNALAAIAVCYSLNIPKHFIYVGLMKARSSGRMEIYSNSDNKVISIVDYAHNKMSFQSLYDSVLKEFPDRRIVTVFGCPGKKAFQRRKDLGELAGKYSDMVYITEEDPGEEPLLNICNEIAQHVEEAGGKYEIEPDRGMAIKKAIFTSERDSVILITGKGNETRQKRGIEYVPCPTDVEYTKKYLKEFDVSKKIDASETISTIQSMLPAFRKLYSKTILIKLGGSILEDNSLIENIYEDVALLSMVGARIVIVHGGGKNISRSLEKNNIKTEFKGGYRVTSKEAIEIAEQVLSGGMNKKIVQGLKNERLNACGISGKDAGLISAEKKVIPEGDIGFVGEVKKVDTTILEIMMENGYIPVISPVSSSENGDTLNVNADDAAFAVAEALKADTLVFLTDVDGILLDVANSKTIINSITLEKGRDLLRNGFIGGGMLPKLKNCISSVENGVNEVAIINGREKYNLVSYFITKNKIGTTIKK
ncbi:MAG: acetylglutamate kinase [Clostridia bacterium]|nr:acetylglutamate kinase [Clostridia bacterium]